DRRRTRAVPDQPALASEGPHRGSTATRPLEGLPPRTQAVPDRSEPSRDLRAPRAPRTLPRGRASPPAQGGPRRPWGPLEPSRRDRPPRATDRPAPTTTERP